MCHIRGGSIPGVALLGALARFPADHLLQRRAVFVVRIPSCRENMARIRQSRPDYGLGLSGPST